jgi:hypothetical protein
MLANRIVDANHGQSAPLMRRLLARLRAGTLDQALAAGADPASSAQLRIRAQTLTDPPRRTDLAEGIDLLLLAARGAAGPHPLLARRAAIEANRPLLRSISRALRDDGPAPVRGVAMISTLLSDGTGPLYGRGRAQEVTETLEEAYATLTLAAAA